MDKMNVIVCTKYGPPEVLKIVQIDKPIPRENELLIKVIASTVHIGDTKIRSLKPGLGPVKDFFFIPLMRIILGFRGPRKKILGMELSGVVEAVGKSVTKFKVGDDVFASTANDFGAYAGYRCLPENGLLAIKPKNMTYEEAAPISNGGLTALLLLRKAKIQKGQKVFIYGASGSVGTYAVQLAKYYGAEVTAACSASNIDMVKSLGADRIVDYTKEDFLNGGEQYAIIFDAVGKFPDKKRNLILKASGIYVNVLDLSNNLKFTIEDLNFLQTLCESGHLRTVIDKTYAMEDIVEAHRYVEKGHKKGNVVLLLKHSL